MGEKLAQPHDKTFPKGLFSTFRPSAFATVVEDGGAASGGDSRAAEGRPVLAANAGDVGDTNGTRPRPSKRWGSGSREAADTRRMGAAHATN